MENIDERLKRIEQTLDRHSERFVIIEGKLANDYKSIASLVEDVKMLKAASEANSAVTEELVLKVNEMDKSFKQFMEAMTKAQSDQELRDIGMKKMMGKHNKLLLGAIILSVSALVYATIRNGTLASAITTIVSLATKFGIV